MVTNLRSVGLVLSLLVVAGSCSNTDNSSATTDSSAGSEAVEETSETETDEGEEGVVVDGDGLDLDLFFDGALAEEATTENCTLSGGEETTCYRITIAGYPAVSDVGPFCPTSLTDDADAGGLWFDGTAIYDIDGDFIAGLAELYDDDAWKLQNDDGTINVTDTADEFDAAARPDVDPDLQNHCVEGRLEWLENGEPIQSTVVIPAVPVAADSPNEIQGSKGITLEGVIIAESAPVQDILGNYTIAAFDDCGAHFNPGEGYHMHGAVGCHEHGEATEDETPIFGYAMDGYPIHSPMEGVELDECNGHTTEEAGYHYHANSAEKNEVLPCLVGQTVASETDEGRGGPPAGDGDRPAR